MKRTAGFKTVPGLGKLIGLAVVSFATGALAQGGAPAAPNGTVVQKLDKGEVNWSSKTVTATGSGTFSNSSSNAAQARLGATRAAKMDAYRNLLEIVKGVNLSSQSTVGNAMTSTDIKSKIEGVVKGAEVSDTKYFSDGGVDVVLKMSLDGALADAVLPGGSAAAATAGGDGYTGLIIDAKGLGASPALSPRVLDDAGKELYSATVVNKDKLHDHGVAAYVKSLDAARAEKRAGAKPLVLKVAKVSGAGKADLVVSAKDAAQVKGSFLSDGNVVIVTD